MRSEVVDPKPTDRPLEPLEVTIGFEDASAELPASGIKELQKIMASPQLTEGAKIYIGAHTDSTGTDAANLSVSLKRGETVRDWFMKKGIAAERMTLVVFGEQNPVQPNALSDGSPNEAGRRANRRVEVRVIAAQGAKLLPREPTLAEDMVDQ
ncbi:OmpA family protein [Erythrobacter sp. sf7]|uniref:OmpA family protein n=1 Tax=Erythrobacter fulvus TaxID=2987523 RepID=A0ABT5JPR4_9SPHN|nr:OmpA family protein [Erythrobacter fulvus]MDC8754760.1 OmpA family protein [Erythrobacter fulvus]